MGERLFTPSSGSVGLENGGYDVQGVGGGSYLVVVAV